MKKKLLVGLGLAGIIAASVAVGAYAASDIKLFINGKAISSGVEIIDDSSYVPLRVVSEALGAEVKWDGDKREIHIESAPSTSTPAVSAQPSPSPSTPSSSSGLSRSKPASIGSTVPFVKDDLLSVYKGDVSVQEVIRGEEANKIVKATNRFNDDPKPGNEFIIAKVKIDIKSNTKEDAKVDISPVHFTLVSSVGKDYDRPMIVDPEPGISTSLYVGASHTGWVTFEVAKDDADPLITYAQKYDGSGGAWFKTK